MIPETTNLLPFFYRPFSHGRFLVVNQAGEYTILTLDQFNKLLSANKEVMGDLYPSFKGKHLIADDDTDLAIELLATKLRTRKQYLNFFTALHMVVVTLRCNCICDYCHASSADTSRTDLDMDLKTVRKVVDTIFLSPSPSIKIEFQGGEPLLNWNAIKECVLYANSLNKRKKKTLEYVICTNLIEMDSEKLAFCKEHNIAISTSLDGPVHLHNLHRKSRNGCSSYGEFINKLSLTRDILGQDQPSPLLTVTKSNLYALNSVIDHYLELGFSGLFIRALNPYGYAVTNYSELGYSVDEFVAEYKKALMYIIDLNLKGHFFVEQYAELLLQRTLTPFSTGFVDLQSPSGAGISGVIYDYNGDIYPADEGRMLARMGDKKFLMGNVYENSYSELFQGAVIKELVSNSCVEILPECATCAYQLYCGADPIRYYVECGDVVGNRSFSGFCKKNRQILDFLFELLDQNDENILNVFWSWITRRRLGDVALGNS